MWNKSSRFLTRPNDVSLTHSWLLLDLEVMYSVTPRLVLSSSNVLSSVKIQRNSSVTYFL